MLGFRAPARVNGNALWPLNIAGPATRQRKVHVLYRTESASACAPVSSLPAALPVTQLDGLALDGLSRPTNGVLEGNEPLQTLTRLAASTTSCQVLEALSKTALVLRDSAVAASNGTPSPHTAHISLQALFQNGYDTMVALLQALPQCACAYSPAAVIPETCVTLFHVHNVLLQAAYASQQDFEVWTELMQAGLGLYLLKAPRNVVTYTNRQLDTVLDALAHQDLWRFQRLLWQRMLPCIPTWDCMQDFCSVIQGCEVQAQAATTAAAAALLSSSSAGAQSAPFTSADAAAHWPSSPSSLGPLGRGDPYGSPRMEVAGSWPSTSAAAGSPFGRGSSSQQLQHREGVVRAESRTAPATAAAASALYDKQTELTEYTCLMSECIRAAMDAAAFRGLSYAPQPHAAALQLLEVATAFDARQRSPLATAALRYSFIPSSDWLSQVAATGVQAGERLNAAQVVKLLQDLDSLAPKPVDSHSRASRWLNGAAQTVIEKAIMRQVASNAWAPQQALSVIKVLTGKCRSPPGDQFCGMVEGLLLACHDARQDVMLLCTLLQESVDLSTPVLEDGAPIPPVLTPAHLSLVRVALNRAIYLVGSSAGTSDSGLAAAASIPSTSGRGFAGGSDMWRNREFLFDRYPRLLQAARHFGYPLQAFRIQDYAAELYNHLATAPGHELVAVGPEGLTRVLGAVSSTPCCGDPQWAAAFERACLNLVAVQFSVGYTHPKRWMGLLEATVNALPFPMPTLAAAMKALMVRLCDTQRHAKYFWDFLPLVGALERRAATGGRHPPGPHSHHHDALDPSSLFRSAAPPSLVMGSGCSTRAAAKASSSPGSHRRGPYATAKRAPGGAAATSGARGLPGAGQGAAVVPGAQVDIVPPPNLAEHLVSEEEYNRWCEDLGQRLALSMTCWSDQDRVAQLSVLGITAI